jgi:hypothetical protein
MTLYIYADEAGNFSGKRDAHFVLAAFSTDTPRATRKVFLTTRQTKLPKRFRSYAEVRFSDVNVPRSFKIKVLERLCAEDIGVYALILHKEGMPANLRGREEGLFYCRLVGELLELSPVESATQVRVLLDRRRLKNLTREQFNADLQARLAKVAPNVRIEIEHIDSTTNVNIQIADFIAGAFFQKYERGDDEFYRALEHCIKVEVEIFQPRQ